MNRTLYQWQDDSGGWQRGRLVVDSNYNAMIDLGDDNGVEVMSEWVLATSILQHIADGGTSVLLEPIHRTQFSPMVWVAVSNLQVAPTGEERNG